MTIDEFKAAISELQKFEAERQTLQSVLDAISPTSTAVVETGGYFIESYIKVMEIALKCPKGWVSGFVFESVYGKYPMTGEVNGKDFSIYTIEDLYNQIQEFNQ